MLETIAPSISPHDTTDIRVLDTGEVLHFDHTCGEVWADDGYRLQIKKDSLVDHHRPEDWLIELTDTDGDTTKLPVVMAQIFERDKRDYIVLTLDQTSEVPYQGPLTVRFGVDTLYHIVDTLEMGYAQARERDAHGAPTLAQRIELHTTKDSPSQVGPRLAATALDSIAA